MVGGYSYDDFRDVLDVLFDEETAPILIIIILGFAIAIVYFAYGAYSIWSQEKTVEQIKKCENEVLMLQQKIKRKDTIVHFIELLNKCDADTTMIEKEMECKKKELLLLKQRLQQ